MEFFPAMLSPTETKAAIARVEAGFGQNGFGLWAVELRESEEFIGFVGLAVPGFEAHFTPCVEVGWRLAAGHWGRGLATEAARTAIRHGFDELQLNEIVAFTVPANVRSRRVMEKPGMTHDPRGDFDHPMIAEGHPFRRHVLYRLQRSQLQR